MESYEDSILAETDKLIELSSIEQNSLLSTKMVDSCRRQLSIISRDLDPYIYAAENVVNAIKKLALRSRLSTIRILVLKAESLRSREHPLFELSERLSSFIEIKKAGDTDVGFNKALLLADDSGYILRPQSDRFECVANFNDRKMVSELLDEFNQLWERGEPDPNFRRLAL